MKIDSIQPVVDPTVRAVRAIETKVQERELIPAVRAINSSEILGESNELTYSMDPDTKRPIAKIVSRKTGEVVRQVPSEEVIRLAARLKRLANRG